MSIILNGDTGVTYPNGSLSFPALTYAAGTTALAPVNFQSGTNLTTATAGAMEYDGLKLMFTPSGAQRGVVPGMQLYRLNSNLVGNNVNTAQAIVGVGCTLSANTTYAFEYVFAMSKTAGTTTHAIQLGFGGTATITNLSYYNINTFNNSFIPIAAGGFWAAWIATAAATTVVVPTNTAGLNFFTMSKGTVSIGASGGTFIPQYTLTAAPGGAYTVQTGAYVLIYPIGASGANVNVGTWA